MRTIVNGLALALVAGTLVACGTARGDQPGSAAGAPEVQPQWTSCDAAVPRPTASEPAHLDGTDAIGLPRLGNDFAAAAVVVCGQQPQRRADGGEDMAATEARAEDITALVAALRLPDQPRTDGACTMDLPTAPWFALLDAQGRWVRPGIPKDQCGKIRVEVRDAIDGLRLTTTSSRTIKELESAQAAAAGCGQSRADMIWALTSQGSGPKAAAGSTPFTAGQQLRLCVYRVPAAEQGSGKPSGEFERGGILPPERWAPIEKALLAAGPAAACTTPASRFAVLLPTDDGTGGGSMYVELDGCHRIMTEPGTGPSTLAQGDAALAALLAAR